MSLKIVMLTGPAISSRFMYNGLSKDLEIHTVIRETPVPMKTIMKNRAKKLGWFNVLGQIAFGVLILPILRTFSKNQKEKVIQNLGLSDAEISPEKLVDVSSVNSGETIEILKKINPDVVIVNGCRIVSKKVLSAIDAVFINTHEGITPRYRGIHGGYWALVNEDLENCGVTVHLVDKGVDTGGILYQARIHPEKKDNFTTFPFYQTAAGIPLMKKAIEDVQDNSLKTIEPKLESRIWYHPTIWEYVWNYLRKGVA
ncbi:MAG: formyl transferase [Flavobacteriaceae bacterium]|nr:formyl transferase [Flavobacteriaceae bacterium]